MQRVRVGLTGLAFVFLLVLLGTVITGGGDEPGNLAVTAEANQQPNEPLAELGVAPRDTANQADDQPQ